MASYDYSAVLYLNCKGNGFEGGDFVFVDDKEDQVVQPRTGRLLLFASGFEHLHRVAHVTSGNRFVLASWYSLSPSAGEALLPACYELGETAPIPPGQVEDRYAH